MRRRAFTVAAAGLSVAGSVAAADPFDLQAGMPHQGKPKTVTRDFFGLHVHDLALHPGEKRTPTPWPDIPFGWLRLWDSGTLWAEVNPRPGEWEFRRMDRFVDLAEAHGTKILYTFGMTPRWASARPDEHQPYGLGLAAEPTKLSYWTDYVRKVCERYRGRIQAYEVWNEPEVSELRGNVPFKDGFFSGSMKSLIELTRTAREVVKSIDPDALLLSPAFTNSLPHLSAFFAAGGGKWVDAIGYHLYSGGALHFAGIVRQVRTAMATAGYGHLPLWNTESSVPTEPNKISYDPGSPERGKPEQAAALLAQLLLLSQCGGVERYFYYTWDDRNTGLVNASFRETPSARAVRRVEEWTIGARPLGSASFGSKGVRCDYAGNADRSIVAWSDDAAASSLALPSGWRAVARQDLLDSSERTLDAVGSLDIVLSPAPTRVRLHRAQPA